MGASIPYAATRQHRLPGAGETEDPDLFCAGCRVLWSPHCGQ